MYDRFHATKIQNVFELAIFEDFCKEQKTMEWTEKAICEIERAQNLQIYTNF
jgi:hypothetical protein